MIDVSGRSDAKAFIRTRAALAADRPRAVLALLAAAVLVLALGGAWALRARLAATGAPAHSGISHPAAPGPASPAALTLRVSGPHPTRP